MDVGTFCERSVDVMGEESDHIHAQALCDAVQVSCRGEGIKQSRINPSSPTAANKFVPKSSNSSKGMHCACCIQ